jgi:WXG100 family type VII secretion target
MSTPFKVTPEMLSAASSNCTSTAEEISQQLSSLRNYVVNLEAVWHGVAADTFSELMADYDVYVRMMHDALTDIGSGLMGNQVNYTAAEQSNINSLQPVNGAPVPGQPGSSLPPGNF